MADLSPSGTLASPAVTGDLRIESLVIDPDAVELKTRGKISQDLPSIN